VPVSFRQFLRPSIVSGLLMLGVACAGASTGMAAVAEADVRELIEQNRRLQQEVQRQRQTIDELSARMNDVLRTSERQEAALRGLQDRVAGAGTERAAAPVATGIAGGRSGVVRIAGETGLTYFKTGRAGQFPHGEFRADDPTVTFEAPVRRDTYLFGELKLLPRETNAENFELGELYVDFENVLGSWGHDGLLSLRVGRINIPFGEEYLVRSPVANPLISHSLSDFWGCDEGVELYGRIGPFQYVLAVQNGGISRLHDFDSDKSVAVRVGWQPANWLHTSVSLMRTGELSLADAASELWIGDNVFRSIGAAASTTNFWANLAQLDAKARWSGGSLGLTGGVARYDDDDTAADNARRIRFGYVELVQTLAGNLYGAARYSGLRAPGGYPFSGWGSRGKYFFRDGARTEELRRLSVGLGYRFGPPMVLKFEYAWESGRQSNGARRDNEDFLGTQLGVRF